MRRARDVCELCWIPVLGTMVGSSLAGGFRTPLVWTAVAGLCALLWLYALRER